METVADLKPLAEKLNPAIGFYDPLNLAEADFWGMGSEATVGWLRHAEIKHGRVAMAAFVGYLVHANGIHFPWKIPGDELCAPGVSPPDLWHGLPEVAKVQIVCAVGFLEWWSELRLVEGEKHYMKGGKPGYFPDFTASSNQLPHPGIGLNLYDPFKFHKNLSEEKKAAKLVTEINNGRLAMLGIFGFLSEAKIPGSVPLLKGIIAPMDYNVMAPFVGDFSNGVTF